ncbi:MAG: hypothetical protein J6Y76_05895, partial [Paludibacteraceae bacterium]|nr:hypothetical protein [Paludibacteraceae bacterium]
MRRTVLTSVMALALSMMALSFATAAPAAESRFIVADSTHALLSGVKMEFLNVNHIPLTSSYDGLIRIAISRDADVMLTGEGLDTLRITLRPSDSPQWIIMKRRPQHFETSGPDLYYSMASPKGKAITRAEMLASRERRKTGTLAEVETLAIVVDEAAPAPVEADGATYDMAVTGYGKPAAAANNLQAGKLTAGEVNDFAKWHLWNHILTQS